jgi:thymidylate synthase ThyX
MQASLRWATPNGEQLLADMARISAPENIGKDAAKLIGYLIRNKHWSPFEMINACIDITTTRDIGRQILRHSSLRPQEFSQRYADARKLGGPGVPGMPDAGHEEPAKLAAVR